MLKSLISKGLTVPPRGENRYNIPYQGVVGGGKNQVLLLISFAVSRGILGGSFEV